VQVAVAWWEQRMKMGNCQEKTRGICLCPVSFSIKMNKLSEWKVNRNNFLTSVFLTGCNIAYIYPDFKTAFVGTFKDGQLECAQVW
jgi:hypothetical protein